jgi:hypothetical protein
LLVGATMTQRPGWWKSFIASGRDGHVALPHLYRRSRLGVWLRNGAGQQRKCSVTSKASPYTA